MCDTIMELYSIIFILCGNRRLSLFKISIDFEMLFAILSLWLFQLRFSFRIRPRKLKSCTLSITTFCIFNFGGFIRFCFEWKTVYLVFGIFRDNLLTISQSVILDNSIFIPVSIFSYGVLGLNACKIVDNVVSSAYMINAKILLTCDMSFM